MKHLLSTLITIAILTILRTPLHAALLGEWTHHYAYDNLTHVVPTTNAVYAVSAARLFAYNPSDESLRSYDVTNGLSANDSIIDICWNKTARQLVIAYNSGNIDLMDTKDNSVTNLAAIENEITTRSKRIQTILCNDRYAYIVMPYGVVIVNTQKREFGDTYRFTTGGATFNGAWVENDSLFLVSDKTLANYGSTAIRGKLTDNLLDKSKWHAVSSQRATQVKDKITQYQRQRTISTTTPYITDTYHACHWGEGEGGGLLKYTLDDDGTYTQQWQKGRKPYGPSTNDFFTIKWLHDKLYTTSTGWRTNNDTNNPGVVQTYEPASGWRTFQTPDMEATGVKFVATSDITVDPRDTSHVMVSTKSGLYEFKDGRFMKHWNSKNSSLKALADGNSLTYQMVLTSAYDKEGTLWVTNSGTSTGLHQLKQTLRNGEVTDSKWTPLTHTEIDKTGNDGRILSNAKFDSKGRLWFINLSWLNVEYYCYEPSTDRLTVYTPDYNQDGTKLYNSSGDGYLRDINIDRQGNVWLCGTKGICYLPANSVGTAGNTVEQYKIARNDGTGLADYLLSTVDATCIIFDSAGRKYIGTDGNGIYVISADNNEELQNYTTANSDIMSNNVRCLALDEQTGTLYCSTDRGLCSVRTDAIAVPSSLDKNNIRVYPNPVRPDYTGMITFEGLTVGADIKITTATGAVVHTGRSTSALYQWDGCDQSGNRCASGVYNILLATDDGSEGCVAKVAIIK